MTEIFSPENLAALLTLSAMEIVLGIDNVVFLAILTGRLEPSQRAGAQRIGLGLAMFARIALLLAISWVMKLDQPWFTISGRGFSGRSLILLVGGLFLIAKATWEIHDKLEGKEHAHAAGRGHSSLRSILMQIVALDLVFSIDSVITAVGMADRLWIMVVAVVLAVLVMMIFAGRISAFIERHPTMKMLALSFLLMIGVMLVAEGFGQHVEKGYVYTAMAFSLFVEVLNMRLRRGAEPVVLRQRIQAEAELSPSQPAPAKRP